LAPHFSMVVFVIAVFNERNTVSLRLSFARIASLRSEVIVSESDMG
jgi:hypothetical protein